MSQKKNPLYHRYRNMMSRCFYIKDSQYKNYGARGITVCDRWRGKAGFENYITDVGLPPHSWYSLDRIDNDKGYEPGNMRWATPQQQTDNTRPHKLGMSGVRGVSWSDYHSKWKTAISHEGRSKLIGYYDDKYEAGEAYRKKYIELKHKEPN